MTAAASNEMSNLWWLVLLEGVAVLILGILLITDPALTVNTLIVFLGVYWLIDGIFSLIRIFVNASALHWGWLLGRGILGILAGLMVVRNPLWAALFVPIVLVIILGVQGVIIGAIRLVQAFKGDGVWAGVTGAVSTLFGLILIFNPLLRGITLPVVAGMSGIISGIVLIFQAFRVHKI